MKNFMALSLLLAASFAHANCATGEYLDLRSHHSKIFKKVPVKDQGSYGLCYAYAGTTLVDFYRHKNPQASNTNISPLEAGLLSTILDNGDGEVGGQICNVVNSLSRKGKACTDSIVGSETRYQDIGVIFHTQIVQKVFMPYVTRAETFQKLSPEKFKSRQKLTSLEKKYVTRFDEFYLSFKKDFSRRSFPANTLPSPSEIFAFAQKVHIDNTYNLLAPRFTLMIAEKICDKNTIPVPNLICKDHSGTPDSLIVDLDHELNAKKPAGITYCSVMLDDRNVVGMDYSGVPKSTCKMHGSVIIGRKSDSGGRCHYLIRNSWGTNYKYAWPSSEGDVWVSEYMLKRNIYQVHSVQ